MSSNRLALALKAASQDALSHVSLESISQDLDSLSLSLEDYCEEMHALSTLAEGLESVVYSLESIEQPSLSQQRLARSQVRNYLQISGLSNDEIATVIPSMEAEGSSSGWDKFKAFLLRLWEMIKQAVAKVGEFVFKLLQRSTMGEKIATTKLMRIKGDVLAAQRGITKNPSIGLTPAHRYLFSSEGQLSNMAQVRRNVQQFKTNRDKVLTQVPKQLNQVANDLTRALDQLVLTGDDAAISASVKKCGTLLAEAVKPLFPSELGRTLGAQQGQLHLIYDRVVRLNGPQGLPFRAELTDELISEIGMQVTQIHVVSLPDELPQFPALTAVELKELHKMAVDLLDSSNDAEALLKWSRSAFNAKVFGVDIDALLKTVLKKEGLDQDARDILKYILRMRKAVTQWVQVPVAQISAVNLQVVNALVAMLYDQTANYEHPHDPKEERVKEEKPEKKDSKKDA